MQTTIQSNLEAIREFLHEKADVADPVGVVERLNDAVSLLGLSSETIAEAEKIYLIRLGVLAEQYRDVAATAAKNIIAGKLHEELYYKTLAESYDKQLHYTIESLRTVISFLKTEMQSVK